MYSFFCRLYGNFSLTTVTRNAHNPLSLQPSTIRGLRFLSSKIAKKSIIFPHRKLLSLLTLFVFAGEDASRNKINNIYIVISL
jgi:hypothetical protein